MRVKIQNFVHVCVVFSALFLLGATSLVFIPSAFAAPGINKKINFQGKLVNADGTNVADNTYSVVFTLYDDPSAGSNLWDETQNVTTVNGIFQVALGTVDTTIGNVNFNADNIYLGIKVGADAEMTPRVRFSSVPYAFNAEKFSGLTAVNGTTSFTITGGTSTPRTVTISGADITIGSIITPTAAGGLTLQSNGANSLILDAGGSAGLTIGTTNANSVSISKAGTTTTINGGLTVTAGQTVTLNSDVFTDFTGNGLTVSSNALTVSLTASDNTGATSSNSGLEVGASGLTLLKGCADGQLLEYTDAGGWACATDDSSAGGGSNWTVSNGVLRPNNNTLDFLLGGTSTASAKFAFGGLNSGKAIATFSGDLMFEAQPNSSTADQTAWTKVTQTTPGTIASGGTTLIASISAMAVYNGNVYVGTYKDAIGGAEVYRYEGDGAAWTKVTQTTPGTIASGGTANVGSVSAMTVFDGRLYVGTSKMNAAEIYRYDGGTNWTRVSGTAPGTIGAITLVDGVSSLGVFQGRLYAGTREVAGARLMRWDGGSTWTSINGTAGTFVATNTVGVNAVMSMTATNGGLYLGLSKQGDADVVKYTGAATFLALNAAGLTGSYTINGTAVTGFDEVTAVTVYNGNLVLGMQKLNGAEVLLANPQVGETGINSFTRLNNAAGQLTSGGTSSIDQIAAMTIYNGMLYVATREGNSAEIYRYTGGDQKFMKVSAGTGQIASGGMTGIDGVVKMIATSDDLFAGTMELGATEIYKLSNITINKSYALKFHASPSIVGESGVAENTASIFYLASASANLSSNDGNTGAFIFSHGIQTKNGSYDVAEDYPTRDDSLVSGDLVSIDTNERGFVKKSEGTYDHAVIGVYSENPALRLSQIESSIDGGRAIPVALAGRVPVKVTTENGNIFPGDYLTTSSKPGVAMKATKSGIVIGQAMESFLCDTENACDGKVLVYVKSSSYQGSVADTFVGIDLRAADASENILAVLQKQSGLLLSGSSHEAEIVTDKLIAGLEIVTQKITADTIYAKKIKADQIEGLEIFVGKITLQASSGGMLTDGMQADVHGIATSSAHDLVLTSLSVDGLARLDSVESNQATISANLRVKNNTLIEGMLHVIDTITTNNLLVTKVADFFGAVIFHGDVVFRGHPIFAGDTVGVTTIKKGTDRVEVVFEKAYEQRPIVTASLSLDDLAKDQKEYEERVLGSDIHYIVTKRTTKGFTILLNKQATEDLLFSWIALPRAQEEPSFSPTPTPRVSPDVKGGDE